MLKSYSGRSVRPSTTSSGFSSEAYCPAGAIGMGASGIGAAGTRAAVELEAALAFTLADARAGGLRDVSADAALVLSVGASLGSALMMLTAGIESADGKK
jgi:hypothetical protein